MRVLRTELYFDPGEVPSINTIDLFAHEAINLGVSFAWFQHDWDIEISQEELNSMVSGRLHRYFENQNFLPILLDYFIRDDNNFFAGLRRLLVLNEDLVDRVLALEIVMEHSPPFSIPFAELLKAKSPMAVGAFTGMVAGMEHPILMLLTVPMGIIAVGSAVGISKAMENGLNKKVSQLFGQAKVARVRRTEPDEESGLSS